MSIFWVGLYLGIAQTGLWQTPLAQPGLLLDVTAVVKVGPVYPRVLVLVPLQKDGYGPALQIGASVRLF